MDAKKAHKPDVSSSMIKKIKDWLYLIVVGILMAPIFILASLANARGVKKRRKKEKRDITPSR